jgi:hypothetical protein
MSADDLFILPFGACVFALMIAGLILMSEYEGPLRRKPPSGQR